MSIEKERCVSLGCDIITKYGRVNLVVDFWEGFHCWQVFSSPLPDNWRITSSRTCFFLYSFYKKKQFIKQFEVLRSLNNQLTNCEIMNFEQAQIFKYLNINKMTLKYYSYSYFCHFPSDSFVDFWTTKYI